MGDASSCVTGLLPVFDAPATRRVWLVAAHGGAGCSTIYRSAPELYADAGRAFPVPVDGSDPVFVLCAMGSCQGLESLRRLLSEWDRGLLPGVLAGVAVTDCMPRMPRSLVRGGLQVCSPAPCRWRLPYIASLPVEGFPDRWPFAYRRMASRLEGLPAVAGCPAKPESSGRRIDVTDPNESLLEVVS
ncbi:DUF6668 family protein [Bifidobacterium sp. UBA4282]|uniref:DUF6668 family protein n=1 Tax=Bifidobacterium sp. UBA4282 TaxID=1946096 RepID=UPI0032E44D0E